jgi:hypothetical protein
MSAPRSRVLAATAVLILGGVGSMWHVMAQGRAIGTPLARPAQDRILPPSVDAGNRGNTYHWLESRATRVTTRFADAVAVAQRAPDGRLSTRLTDLAGNEVAELQVESIDAENDSLEFTIPDRPRTRALRRAGLRPTLDWGTEQAYSLWKDRVTASAALEWQGVLMRPAGAARRATGVEAIQVDTEWSGGYSATVTRKIGTHISYVTNRRTTGVVFISSFKKDGVEVGFSQWWPQEQAFAWSFPGLTDGYVTSARLQPQGGWGFAPDMAWMNTQNLAFYQFHSLVATQGKVSERQGGWLDRVGNLLSAQLHANEPGCDHLHWLDGSIFRPCCDSHDRCYMKEDPACGASSWWMFWSSWQCTKCNIYVVACFGTGANRHVLNRFP